MNKLRLPWSHKDDKYIIENYVTQSKEKISEVLQRTPNAIKRRAHILGVSKQLASRKWEKWEVDYLKKHFPNSTKDVILKGLNRNWTAIRTKAVTLKIKRESRYKMPKGTNHYFFDTWSQEMSYILGFIAADGCIRKNNYGIEIKLSRKDETHLEKIKDLVAPGKKLRHVGKINNGKLYECVSLEIGSKYMSSKVQQLGLPPRKSLVLEFPDVPEKYINHFVRGYFDGDGCISQDSNSKYWVSYFLGTLSFLETINKYLDTKSIVDRKNIMFVKQSNIYRLKYATYDSIKLGQWLYADSTIHLGRKYKKFQQLIEERQVNR